MIEAEVHVTCADDQHAVEPLGSRKAIGDTIEAHDCTGDHLNNFLLLGHFFPAFYMFLVARFCGSVSADTQSEEPG